MLFVGWAPPPPYAVSASQRKGWPGEVVSTTTMSDSEIRSPNQIKIQDYKSSLEKIISNNSSRRGEKSLNTITEKK